MLCHCDYCNYTFDGTNCMHCISVCSVGVKKLGRVITDVGGITLGVFCANRKECELFF